MRLFFIQYKYILTSHMSVDFKNYLCGVREWIRCLIHTQRACGFQMFLSTCLVDCLQGFAYKKTKKLSVYKTEEWMEPDRGNERYPRSISHGIGQEQGQCLCSFLWKQCVSSRYPNAAKQCTKTIVCMHGLSLNDCISRSDNMLIWRVLKG